MVKSPSVAHTQLMGVTASLSDSASFFDGVLVVLVLIIAAALVWDRFREPVTMFTGVLALATLALVYVSVLQWRASEKTDETFRAGERAFVFPAQNNVAFQLAREIAGKVIRLYPIVWENSGNSPTVNLVIKTYCLDSLPLPEENPIAVLHKPSADLQRLLGPKQTAWGGARIYSAEQLDNVRGSGYHLYIASTADYFDIFDKHHYTEACFELTDFSKDDKFEDAKVIPRADINNCGRNCADEECKKP
jgi:hypothetical protein